MHNRQRMRISNGHATKYLLQRGYNHIWLKAHTKFKDKVQCQDTRYYALDLWNLYDGLCFDTKGILWAIQIKTNAWAKASDIITFQKDHKIKPIVLNVKKEGSRWKVFERKYE